MTADELLKESAKLAAEHAARWAGKVPLDPADSAPHDPDSGKSDYAEHAHLMSAPPDVDDQLNRKLAALLDYYRTSNSIDEEPADSEAERRFNFRDYWLHGKGLTRWTTAAELTEHLTKFLSPPAAKRIARQWFKDRYGTDPNEAVPG